MEKSRIVGIRVSEEIYKFLAEAEKQTGLKKSEIVKTAITKYLRDLNNPGSSQKYMVEQINNLTRRYYDMENRINLLKRQIDYINVSKRDDNLSHYKHVER